MLSFLSSLNKVWLVYFVPQAPTLRHPTLQRRSQTTKTSSAIGRWLPPRSWWQEAGPCPDGQMGGREQAAEDCEDEEGEEEEGEDIKVDSNFH